MATLQELIVKIGADTDGLDKIEQGLGKVRDTGSKMTDVGKNLTVGVTTPIVGMGAAILTTAGSFESSMNDVRAVTGATGQDLQDMTDLAKEMGSTTAFSASESADALAFLGMAGLDAQQSMDALPGILDLAAASGMELATTADIATNILSGFGLEVDQLARLNDVLAEAARSSNTSVEQLGGGFTYVGPVASAAGMSLEETAATLGMLADAGIQGEQGGTALRGALSRLLQPTADVQSRLDSLGVTIQDADGSMRPFADIMGDLEAAGADVNDMLTIFGVEAGPGMMAILERGSDDLRDFTGNLENAEGAAKEMADIKMEGLQGQLKQLQSATEGVMLAIADSGLLETVTSLLTKAAEWMSKMGETSPELLKWGTIIAAVVAAVGPLLIFLGMLVTAIGQIGSVLKFIVPLFKLAAGAKMLFNAALWASPITWIILGIIALIAVIILIIVYWDEIKAATAAAWDWIVAKLGAVWDWIKSTASSVWEGIKSFFVGIWEGIKSGVASAWDWITNKISSTWNAIVAKVTGAVNAVKTFISTGFTAAKNLAINAVLGMHNRVVSTVAGLISFVRGIPGRIRSALGNLSSLLVNAGKNVIRGLINGIKSMFGSLSGTASEMASTIRNKLPFSPAKEGPLSGAGAPERSGARIAEGIGDGIMAELLRIDRAADALMAPLDARVTGMRDVAREIPTNVNTAVGRVRADDQRLVLDVTGADEEWKRLIRRMVRTEGRGNVQLAFGR